MLRLVLDTNIIISGLLWQGKEFELLKKIEAGKALLLVNLEILAELHKVLHYEHIQKLILKASLTDEQLFGKIVSMSHIVVGQKLSISACRDLEDNKFLECAINGKANFIVSGDEDLLILKQYESIPIITTVQILDQFSD
ncbi:MAG: putative toxin-antitoxin system toxin component, PIN family [archaeon]